LKVSSVKELVEMVEKLIVKTLTPAQVVGEFKTHIFFKIYITLFF